MDKKWVLNDGCFFGIEDKLSRKHYGLLVRIMPLKKFVNKKVVNILVEKEVNWKWVRKKTTK